MHSLHMFECSSLIVDEALRSAKTTAKKNTVFQEAPMFTTSLFLKVTGVKRAGGALHLGFEV